MDFANYNFKGKKNVDKSEILDTKHKRKTHFKDLWIMLHTTAVFLPDEEEFNDVKDYHSLVKGVLYFGLKFDEKLVNISQKFLKENPIEEVQTRDQAMIWNCTLHNEMNKELGKDLFECKIENIAKRWGNYNHIINHSRTSYL
jgi:hypothetical protein